MKKISPLSNNKGFSLIEIISVLVIIGIISAVAVSNQNSGTDSELLAAAEKLKGHLRYTQMKAMGDNVPWDITFPGANTSRYKIRRNRVGADADDLPGESSNIVDFTGITIARTSNPAEFSGNWGIPTNGNTITLTKGAESIIITVTANTGFIP